MHEKCESLKWNNSSVLSFSTVDHLIYVFIVDVLYCIVDFWNIYRHASKNYFSIRIVSCVILCLRNEFDCKNAFVIEPIIKEINLILTDCQLDTSYSNVTPVVSQYRIDSFTFSFTIGFYFSLNELLQSFRGLVTLTGCQTYLGWIFISGSSCFSFISNWYSYLYDIELRTLFSISLSIPLSF